MNEEIKEILDRIKKHYVLDEEQDIILLNYITNLQEKNKKLNKIIDELENYLKENSIYYNTSDGCQWVNQFKLLDKLTELKKEVE